MIFNKDLAVCGLQAASTFLAGMYYGGCNYVTYCECPARYIVLEYFSCCFWQRIDAAM